VLCEMFGAANFLRPNLNKEIKRMQVEPR
jgi:hypothetical protein